MISARVTGISLIGQVLGLFAVAILLSLAAIPGRVLAAGMEENRAPAAVEPLDEVSVVDAWVTTRDELPRVMLHPGMPVRYHARIFNQTEAAQEVQASWTVDGPCGKLVQDEMLLQSPPGNVDWIYLDTIAPGTCPGDYSLVVTIRYGSAASHFATGFEIVDVPLFLPLLRR